MYLFAVSHSLNHWTATLLLWRRNRRREEVTAWASSALGVLGAEEVMKAWVAGADAHCVSAHAWDKALGACVQWCGVSLFWGGGRGKVWGIAFWDMLVSYSCWKEHKGVRVCDRNVLLLCGSVAWQPIFSLCTAGFLCKFPLCLCPWVGVTWAGRVGASPPRVLWELQSKLRSRKVLWMFRDRVSACSFQKLLLSVFRKNLLLVQMSFFVVL